MALEVWLTRFFPMTLWILIFVLSAITFVALILAGRSKKGGGEKQASETGGDTETAGDPAGDDLEKTEEHFRAQLASIDSDQELGKLNAKDADAARAELARELMQHRASFAHKQKSDSQARRSMGLALPAVSLGAVVVAFGIYLFLGTPEQGSFVSPAAQAQSEAEQEFLAAIEQVELQLMANPDDVQGWRVLGPAYMRIGHYDDAVRAFRRILELSAPTADSKTDLAEALLMAGSGDASPEVLELFRSAAEMDPNHTRSRFYLAAEATRMEQWDQAVEYWNDLMKLSNGTEPWLEMARDGLGIALARGEAPVRAPAPEPAPGDGFALDAPPPAGSAPDDPAQQAEFIRSMVAGLEARLKEEGGTIGEWTGLVRSNLVLGEVEKAREIYTLAVAAYPDPAQRPELEALAAQAGLLENSE